MRLSGAAFFTWRLPWWPQACGLRWPPKAALFPLTMGIPLLVLALVQTLVELRDPGTPVQPPGARSRTLAVFGWMATLILLVLLAGFPIAGAAYSPTSSWRAGKE